MNLIDQKPACFMFDDYETSGTSPQYDQPLQFALVVTDSELNIIDQETYNILIKPRPDIIPHPRAYITHFLDIDELNSKGITEFDFAIQLKQIYSRYKGVAISGYNTIKFDDEVTRNLMYRNLQNPYEHEWKDGASRFDVIRLIEMTYALRPNILNWIVNPDGRTSLKLTDMTSANGLTHENAHDALSDVYATIGLAQLVKKANPNLFQYALNLTNKKNIENMILRSMSQINNEKASDSVLLHVSPMYKQDRNISSFLFPCCRDSFNANKFICVDLFFDPAVLVELSTEEIKALLFTKREMLPEGSPDVGVATITTNKMPAVFDNKRILTPDLYEKMGVTPEIIEERAAFVRANFELIKGKIQSVFELNLPALADPYGQLYTGGFIDKKDSNMMVSMSYIASRESTALRIETVDVYAATHEMIDRNRLHPLILRAKWNNYYENLQLSEYSLPEFAEWVEHLNNSLNSGLGKDSLTFDKFRMELADLRLERELSEREVAVLNKLESHVNEMQMSLETLNKIYASNLEKTELMRKEITFVSSYVDNLPKDVSVDPYDDISLDF